MSFPRYFILPFLFVSLFPFFHIPFPFLFLFAPYRHASFLILATTEDGSGSARIPATALWVFLKRQDQLVVISMQIISAADSSVTVSELNNLSNTVN
jgi:hypothetical protein